MSYNDRFRISCLDKKLVESWNHPLTLWEHSKTVILCQRKSSEIMDLLRNQHINQSRSQALPSWGGKILLRREEPGNEVAHKHMEVQTSLKIHYDNFQYFIANLYCLQGVSKKRYENSTGCCASQTWLNNSIFT